jgi:hypothetical protein
MAKSLSKQPRIYTRIAVNIQVRISTIDVFGKKILSSATLLNVSRGGAAIQLPVETAFDNLVKIHWQDQCGIYEASALPRWKYSCGDKLWRIGVENTENGQRWSSLVYFACQSRAC